MKRILNPSLRRGRVAEGAAVLLFWTLLTVLVLSVVHGVGTLSF